MSANNDYDQNINGTTTNKCMYTQNTENDNKQTTSVLLSNFFQLLLAKKIDCQNISGFLHLTNQKRYKQIENKILAINRPSNTGKPLDGSFDRLWLIEPGRLTANTKKVLRFVFVLHFVTVCINYIHKLTFTATNTYIQSALTTPIHLTQRNQKTTRHIIQIPILARKLTIKRGVWSQQSVFVLTDTGRTRLRFQVIYKAEG